MHPFRLIAVYPGKQPDPDRIVAALGPMNRYRGSSQLCPPLWNCAPWFATKLGDRAAICSSGASRSTIERLAGTPLLAGSGSITGICMGVIYTPILASQYSYYT
jgi:hypothetical protein